MKLRWEWRPRWGYDGWEGYYLHDWRRQLCFSTDGGATWTDVVEPAPPNEAEAKELMKRFPHP